MSMRLVSCNIERSKHLDLVVPFLREQAADVVCLQECMERDIPLLKSVAGEHVFYTPLCFFEERPQEQAGVYGQAILSRYPLTSMRDRHYAGQPDASSTFHYADKEESTLRVKRAVSSADVTVGDVTFRIATTHFTWTPEGRATDDQRRDLATLLPLLETEKEFVLTGDFNAPRGGEIFDALAAKYKDNIPAHYATSIDGSIHRAGPLPYMVDGLFSTPEYEVSDVELHTGVSDHCAMTATVTRS